MIHDWQRNAVRDTHSASLCKSSQVSSVSDQFDADVIETVYLTQPSIMTRMLARCAASHISVSRVLTRLRVFVTRDSIVSS